jgi:hypothetical protein
MVKDAGAERTFRLELTEDELRITLAALRSFLGDFGHDEHEVRDQVRAVLRKLPEPRASGGPAAH